MLKRDLVVHSVCFRIVVHKTGQKECENGHYSITIGQSFVASACKYLKINSLQDGMDLVTMEIYPKPHTCLEITSA